MQSVAYSGGLVKVMLACHSLEQLFLGAHTGGERVSSRVHPCAAAWRPMPALLVAARGWLNRPQCREQCYLSFVRCKDKFS